MSDARCILWSTPEQACTLKRVVESASIQLVGAGCPDSARTGQLASELQCDPIDDIRVALTTTPIDCVLIGDPGSFADQPNDQDLESLKSAHARQVSVVSLEPIPATVNGIGGTRFAEAMSSGALPELCQPLPLTRSTPIIDELQSALETFGPIRSCSLSICAPSSLGSLGARLFDAMDLVRTLIGVPNMIDAGYIAPQTGRGLHPLPGQSLRNLHGEFTINMRFADGRCASILLSDQVGRSSLAMTMLGSEGHLQLFHHGFNWFNTKGEMIDAHSSAAEAETDPMELALTTQLIEQCSGVSPTRAPIDYASVLSMTHATLLSTRTGQGESPHAVEHLMLSM